MYMPAVSIIALDKFSRIAGWIFPRGKRGLIVGQYVCVCVCVCVYFMSNEKVRAEKCNKIAFKLFLPVYL